MQYEKFNRLVGRGEGGYSVVGAILAMGMIGALGIVLVYLTKQQRTIQRKTEIYFELNRLSNRILRGLYDGDGCMETLERESDIIDGRNLSVIRDKKGKVVVDTTQVYGNGLLKIGSISIDNVRINGKSGELDLRVDFKKLGSSVRVFGKSVQSYPLAVEVDALKRLTKCHYDYGSIFFVSAKAVCESLGGMFDRDTEQCTLDDLVLKIQSEACKSLGSRFDASARACMVNNLVRQIQEKSCQSLNGRFDSFSGKCANVRR